MSGGISTDLGRIWDECSNNSSNTRARQNSVMRRIELKSCDITIVTDACLLARVFKNLLKKVLEARNYSNSVVVGSSVSEDKAQIWIHSRESVSNEALGQIFGNHSPRASARSTDLAQRVKLRKRLENDFSSVCGPSIPPLWKTVV